MSEPTVRRRRTVGESNGAEERTRTFTVLLPPAPQAGASANSATSAWGPVDTLTACAARQRPNTDYKTKKGRRPTNEVRPYPVAVAGVPSRTARYQPRRFQPPR